MVEMKKAQRTLAKHEKDSVDELRELGPNEKTDPQTSASFEGRCRTCEIRVCAKGGWQE
jgi:hypothetical protein